MLYVCCTCKSLPPRPIGLMFKWTRFYLNWKGPYCPFWTATISASADLRSQYEYILFSIGTDENILYISPVGSILPWIIYWPHGLLLRLVGNKYEACMYICAIRVGLCKAAQAPLGAMISDRVFLLVMILGSFIFAVCQANGCMRYIPKAVP
jgi:hypothetical protein